MPLPGGSHVLCCELRRSFPIFSGKVQPPLSNLFCFFAGLVGAWTKLLQNLGPYSKSGVGQRQGSCAGTKAKPNILPCISQWPLHEIEPMLGSLRFKEMCQVFTIPPPATTTAPVLYSALRLCSLHFSFWHPTLTWVNPPTWAPGLASSSGTGKGTSTAKPTDASGWSRSLSTATHEGSPCRFITAQLKSCCLHRDWKPALVALKASMSLIANSRNMAFLNLAHVLTWAYGWIQLSRANIAQNQNCTGEGMQDIPAGMLLPQFSWAALSIINDFFICQPSLPHCLHFCL